MRILMSPPPSKRNSIGILLTRVAHEMRRRGYKITGGLFHYLGFDLSAWQGVFVFGTPRWLPKLIRDHRAVTITIGRPEIREEDEALGFPYLVEHEVQEAKMAEAILGASKVAFISHYVKNVWQEIFAKRGLPFPEEKTAIVHHGVDLTRFTPDPSQRTEPFVIGMAGQFRRTQGLQAIFEISRRLQFPHSLVLVGSMTPEYRRVFDAGMINPDLSARTTHIPWVPAEELPNYYRQMSCFYHPNIGEPFGIVVAEALACGVPVVCPRYGGPAEFVLPYGGVAVDTTNWDYGEMFISGMEQAILQIHARLEAYSAGARQQAERLLSIESCVDAYLDLMGLPRAATSIDGIRETSCELR